MIDGDFQGRKLWLDCWLTPAALPQSKRDLAKLGITSPAQMEQPLPKWIRCHVTAVARRDDDGIERNKVQTFDAVGIDQPKVDDVLSDRRRGTQSPRNRAGIMKDERTPRLDMADRVANYFKLTVRPTSKPKRKGK